VPTDQKPAPAAESREEEQHSDDARQPLTPRVSRRFFLSSLGAAGLAATALPLLAATAAPVALKVNGRSYTLPRVMSKRGDTDSAFAGIAPAITAAVYHATGVRVRELPMRIEDLLKANAVA
jgi:hypothetical protein